VTNGTTTKLNIFSALSRTVSSLPIPIEIRQHIIISFSLCQMGRHCADNWNSYYTINHVIGNISFCFFRPVVPYISYTYSPTSIQFRNLCYRVYSAWQGTYYITFFFPFTDVFYCTSVIIWDCI